MQVSDIRELTMFPHFPEAFLRRKKEKVMHLKNETFNLTMNQQDIQTMFLKR